MRTLWGIRHIRYVYVHWRLHRWWVSLGCPEWLVRHPADEDYLDAIWRGEV